MIGPRIVAPLLAVAALVACKKGEEPVAMDGALSTARLAALTQATVYVATEAGTGSGVLIRVSDEGALVATNAHVIRGEGGVRDDSPLLVFRAGERDETRIEAKVLLEDRERDLALLLAPGSAAPRPLPPVPIEDLRPTQPVFVLGFPYGQALATANRAPSVTINRTAISSLRRDTQGNLVVVQLGGGVDPGNSGGPVVTADGRLVGISVAKMMGSFVAFAIPADELRVVLERWDAGGGAAAAPRPAPGPALPPAPRPTPLPPAAEEDKLVHLPGVIEDAAQAGSRLILKLAGVPGLRAYDHAGGDEGAIAIPTDDFIFAAGGSAIVAWLPARRALQVWDSSTRQMLGVWTPPARWSVTNVCMGADRADAVMIRYCDRADPSARCGLAVLNPTALAAPAPWVPMRDFPAATDHVHLRAAGDLSRVVAWGGWPTHRATLYRVGDDRRPAPEWALTGDAGVLVPASGGTGLVYGGNGAVYGRGGEIRRKRELALFPAHDAAHVIGVADDGAVSILDAASLEVRRPAGRFPGVSDRFWTSAGGPRSAAPTSLTYEKRILLGAERVTFLSGDQMVVRKLPERAAPTPAGPGAPSGPQPSSPAVAGGAPPAAGVVPVTTRRGDLFTYDVTVPDATPPLRFSVARGPKGMVITSEGLLAWNVPADAAAGAREQVAIEVVDARNATFRRELELTIR